MDMSIVFLIWLESTMLNNPKVTCLVRTGALILIFLFRNRSTFQLLVSRVLFTFVLLTYPMTSYDLCTIISKKITLPSMLFVWILKFSGNRYV